MDEVKEIVEKKRDIKLKIKAWLKDYENIVLLAVLIFAFALRWQFFILTKNQPFWWDEASYGIIAKSFISNTFDSNTLVINEIIIRPLLLSIMWAGLMLMEMPEHWSKFILEFIPSILSVFFVYLVGKEIYNKRVGIISAFIFSVIWIHLFYTMRFLTDVPQLVFLFSSIYYFILATKKEFDYKYFSISLFLLSLGTLMKYPNGMVFVIYFIILLFGKQLYLNKKKFWYCGIAGVSPMLLAVLLNYFLSGDFISRFIGANFGNASEQVARPIAYNLLNYISIYLQNIFFLLFLIGCAILLFEAFIRYNYIFKNKKLRDSLLLALIMIAFFSFFIFYLRSADDRYFLPTTITMSIFAGFGLGYIYDLLRKYHQIFAILVIVVILFFGAKAQIKQADDIIKLRSESFLQIKQGMLWLKANAPAGSEIVGIGLDPYAIYYGDINMTSDITENDSVRINNADYLIVHVFPPENFLMQYVQDNQDVWQPINGFFLDKENTQAGLIIYKNTGKKIDAGEELISSEENTLLTSSQE